ncbi:MAG: hypothetical protein DRI73_05030 [Bacteroidetes bacterium]|nr:MAG: hypothetical protein DRI73_05030 [Bacteroidota bacterium]
MTNSLKIKSINIAENLSLEDISAELDKLDEMHQINIASWEEFSYKPQVEFKVAYHSGNLFIKYYVGEKYIRAVNVNTNESVWEDSCVEFFVAPDDTVNYFNFEVNCIGTCLVQKGEKREGRKFLAPDEIKNINSFSSLGNSPFSERKGSFVWNLTLMIPLVSICGLQQESLKGLKMKANFYKCGDKLSEMHFLSWNPIGTAQPDFHQPDYFGELEFI